MSACRRAIAAALLAGPVALATRVRADDLVFPDDLQTFAGSIATDQLIVTACREAKAAEGEAFQGDFELCFGKDALPEWNQVATLAQTFDSAAATYFKRINQSAPTDNCSKGAAGQPPELTRAQEAMDVANKEHIVLQREHDDTAKAALAAEIDLKAQRDTVNEARKRPPGAALQTLTSRLGQLQTAESNANAVLVLTSARLNDARARLENAEKALGAAQNKAVASAHDEVNAARMAFHDALDKGMNLKRSPRDFEALLSNPARRDACLNVRKRRLAALGATAEADRFKKDATEAAAARTDAHRSDIMRKAQSIVSGVFSGNGFVEQPGSPDKVIFSVVSALGADSHTNGTQTTMTLNLASLFSKNDKERLTLPPTVRNLTLRANLPLNSTDDVPRTGSSVPSNQPPPTTPSVSRFSLVVGSSVFDESDTRLPSHDTCYQTALAYRPFAENEANETAVSIERRDYFDVCNRIAAYQARLAWRIAMGLETPTGADAGRTKTDVLAAAFVWGPVPWLYIDAFFQGVLEPSRMNNVGIGLSWAANVGGPSSGVDAWGRFGLDVLGVYSYRVSSSTTPAIDDVEVRITPTVRVKILDNSIATLGVGPRLLARDIDHPGLLASFALVYDADSLIDQALTSPAVPVK